VRRLLLLLPLGFLLACDALPPRAGAAPPESCDPADAYLLDSEREPSLSKQALPPGARYTVLSGVTLSPAVASRVQQIDEAFFRRSGKHLTVVSGTRDPARQARAMIRVVELGGSLTRLYGDREAAREIQQSYERARAARKKPEEVVAAVQATIQAQIQRGTYISAHLRAGAVDVRNTTLTEAERKAFRAAVREVGGVSLLEEHRPPHFHLEIDREPEPERPPRPAARSSPAP
jgi:hypothetical protein